VRTRLAWLLVGISGVCAVADTVVVSAFQPLLSEATIAVHAWPLVNLASLGSAVMGALVISRYPRHPIGWLLSIIGVTTSISLLAESYSIWVVNEGGPGPDGAGDLAGWLAALLGGPLALSGLAVMFLLAPDGHFLSRRWRYVAGGAVLGLLLFVAGLAAEPPKDVVGRGDPEHVDAVASAISSAGVLAISVAVLSAVGCMVIRLRRAEGMTIVASSSGSSSSARHASSSAAKASIVGKRCSGSFSSARSTAAVTRSGMSPRTSAHIADRRTPPPHSAASSTPSRFRRWMETRFGPERTTA